MESFHFQKKEWVNIPQVFKKKNALTCNSLEEVEGLLTPNKSLACPFSLNGNCDIYEYRPMICRIFGTTNHEPTLTCPHKCLPTIPLSKKEVKKIMKPYYKIIKKIGTIILLPN